MWIKFPFLFVFEIELYKTNNNITKPTFCNRGTKCWIASKAEYRGGIRTHARLSGTMPKIVDLTTCLHEVALQLSQRQLISKNTYLLRRKMVWCNTLNFQKFKLNWQMCLILLPNLPILSNFVKIKNPLHISKFNFEILFHFQMP